MIQIWKLYLAEKYCDYIVKLSSLNHCAQVHCLTKFWVFLTENYLKSQKKFPVTGVNCPFALNGVVIEFVKPKI